MAVIFTAEAERRRQIAERERRAQKPSKPYYELLVTSSIVEAIHFAKEHGWKEKKVQIKAFPINETVTDYIVEPFEKNCSCPNLLRYEDYFDGGDEDE